MRARLEAERGDASAAMAYERAAERQSRIGWLDELEDERAAIERPWVERSWMVALPHARPGWSLLIAMVRGKVLPGREVGWKEGGIPAVVDACYAARVAELQALAVLEPAELVASLIVSGWLMDGAPGGVVLDLDRLSDAEVASRLAASPPTR